MPGALITAKSRPWYDMGAGQSLIITTVTYPVGNPGALDARAALMRMPGVRDVEIPGTGYMTITREA